MSEGADQEQRTELPSDRRMGDIRKEGQLHVSQELVHVVVLITGFIVTKQLWPHIWKDMQKVLTTSFKMVADKEPLTVPRLYDGFVSLLLLLGPDIITLVLIVAMSASFTVMLQTKWNIREKKIQFRLSALNPISGLTRLVSPQGLVNTGKSIIKLLVMIPVGILALKALAPEMLRLTFMELGGIFEFAGSAMNLLFWKILYILIAIAIFDYAYGHYKWLQGIKMTKQEVKDEHKQTEGDESTKRQIQAKGRARLMQKLTATVPKADVIVTNPTHFAVALQYKKGQMGAPIVLAKGQDYMALRIREIAREAGVPIVERKALARALYASCNPGSEIPSELFRAVAEVLAYVYRLRNPYARAR